MSETIIPTREYGLGTVAINIIRQGETIAALRRKNLSARKLVEDFCAEGWKKRDHTLYSLLDRLMDSSVSGILTPVLSEGTELYRARNIRDSDMERSKGLDLKENGVTSGFNEQESMEPPLGINSAGRNNIAGMSYLYLSEDPETACAEIKVIPKDMVSLATVRVKKPLRIWSFTDGMYSTPEDGLDLGAIFMEIVTLFYRPASYEAVYLPTQAISDYIRKMGFDGLSYLSFFTGRRNYTIFNSHPSYFEFCGSRILVSQGSVQYFWDQNNHTCLKAGHMRLDYEENHSSDMLERLKERLGEEAQGRIS